MCFTYDDSPDVYSEAIRKARKPHKCSGCWSPVSIGDLYVSCFAVMFGEANSFAVCGKCELTRYRIHLQEIEEGCDWHESWCAVDDLREHCENAGVEWSTTVEGQRYLAWKLANERERGSLRKMAKEAVKV